MKRGLFWGFCRDNAIYKVDKLRFYLNRNVHFTIINYHLTIILVSLIER